MRSNCHALDREKGSDDNLTRCYSSFRAMCLGGCEGLSVFKTGFALLKGCNSMGQAMEK